MEFNGGIMGNKKPTKSAILQEYKNYLSQRLVQRLPQPISNFTRLLLQHYGMIKKQPLIEKHSSSLLDINHDVLAVIGNFLGDDKAAQNAIALTNKSLYCFLFKIPSKNRLGFKLALLVAAGKEKIARKLLTEYPELAAQKIKFTDGFGRTFECSPFQYAIWALDIAYMANMMVDCLPQNVAGEKIRMELLNQLQEVKTKGVKYVLDDTEYVESHYNLNPLKDALNVYEDNLVNWNRTTQLRDHWCTVVGPTQRSLPTYLRQEYCCPGRSMRPTPTFDQKKFVRTLWIDDITKGKPLYWGDQLEGLGENFAIYGGMTGPDSEKGERGARITARRGDYAAIVALEQRRLEVDLPALTTRLESPLLPNNYQIQF